MRRSAMMLLLGLGVGICGGQEVNPKDNPLLGTWVYSSGGLTKNFCSKKMVYEPHHQSYEFGGQMVQANATYAVEPGKVYVQMHLGTGGTKAFVILNKNEIMDTLGTGACHWKRQ
jgi:hypothetical protein